MILLGAKYLNPSYDTDPSPLKKFIQHSGVDPKNPWLRGSDSILGLLLSPCSTIQGQKGVDHRGHGGSAWISGDSSPLRFGTFPQKWGHNQKRGSFLLPPSL